jgi:3-oxoacyl-[acyl-carrier protein] reductase
MDGRVAIVSGGPSGIGAATARVLAGLGVSVAVLGSEEVPAGIRYAGGLALAHQTDVATNDQLEAVVVETGAGRGNNARQQ